MGFFPPFEIIHPNIFLTLYKVSLDILQDSLECSCPLKIGCQCSQHLQFNSLGELLVRQRWLTCLELFVLLSFKQIMIFVQNVTQLTNFEEMEDVPKSQLPLWVSLLVAAWQKTGRAPRQVRMHHKSKPMVSSIVFYGSTSKQ